MEIGKLQEHAKMGNQVRSDVTAIWYSEQKAATLRRVHYGARLTKHIVANRVAVERAENIELVKILDRNSQDVKGLIIWLYMVETSATRKNVKVRLF